jgi:hypothetical protein
VSDGQLARPQRRELLRCPSIAEILQFLEAVRDLKIRNPQPITAAVAHQWGVVAEVVPDGKALSRAQELARQYLKAPK